MAVAVTWYAAATEPARELAAARRLRRAGYHAACPIERFQRRIRHATVWTEAAYFPGYVFLRIANGQPIGPVADVRHVRGIVRAPLSGTPLAIPEAVMAAVLDRRLVMLDDDAGSVVMAEEWIAPADPRSRLRVAFRGAGPWIAETVAAAE